MTFNAKLFDALSNRELYEILKSRLAVFMLEQNIICQDLDDVDYKALHCFFDKDGKIVAYLRAYMSEDNSSVQIGRVLTVRRGEGIGKKLMCESEKKIKEIFNCKAFLLHAQTQAQGFYEKCGYSVISQEFMEEGVPHVTMIKNI